MALKEPFAQRPPDENVQGTHRSPFSDLDQVRQHATSITSQISTGFIQIGGLRMADAGGVP
jgi:hypothetical protein